MFCFEFVKRSIQDSNRGDITGFILFAFCIMRWQSFISQIDTRICTDCTAMATAPSDDHRLQDAPIRQDTTLPSNVYRM